MVKHNMHERLTVFWSHSSVDKCQVVLSYVSFFKKILFIYFRERGREVGREGEKHQCVVHPTGDLTWPATQACALTGD